MGFNDTGISPLKVVFGITLIVVGMMLHYVAMHNFDLTFNALRALGKNWTDISIGGRENNPEEIHIMSLRFMFFAPILLIFGGLIAGLAIGDRG